MSLATSAKCQIYRKRRVSFEKEWKFQWMSVPANRPTGAATVRSPQSRAHTHQFYSDFELTLFVLCSGCSREEKYMSWTKANTHVTKEMYPNFHLLYGFCDRNAGEAVEECRLVITHLWTWKDLSGVLWEFKRCDLIWLKKFQRCPDHLASSTFFRFHTYDVIINSFIA